HRRLLGEMIRQRGLGRDEGFEVVVLVTGGAAAPFCVGGGRGILRGARRRFRGLLGEHVFEPGIERLFDLRTGAEIAAHPVFLGALEALAAAAATLAEILSSALTALGEFGALGHLLLASDRGFRA